jgi:hypothetical protein
VTDLIGLIYELLNQLEKVSEASLLVPDNFGKFAISLDEMIPDVCELTKTYLSCCAHLFYTIYFMYY